MNLKFHKFKEHFRTIYVFELQIQIYKTFTTMINRKKWKKSATNVALRQTLINFIDILRP
jgi:hypothetical protein